MTERKWTPGPWAFSFESIDPSWAIVTTSGGAIVANVNADHRQEANAHLIAAAPDLYKALEGCLDSLMTHIHNEYDGVYSEEDFAEIEAPYIAAISKARGETQ